MWCSSCNHEHKKKGIFARFYAASLQSNDSIKQYKEKLELIGGIDPYEMTRNEWMDGVDLWPSITSVNIAMYLLITPSLYTGNDLLNYKSMHCCNHFLSGWVREILVKVPKDDVRFVIAKVSLKLHAHNFIVIFVTM